MQNESKATSGTWGGSRPGAGRKATSPNRINMRVPDDVYEFLKSKPNMSGYLVELVRNRMKVEQYYNKR